MFPFNLDGPAFLLAYALLAVGLCIALWLARRRVPPGTSAPADLVQRLARDPYAIACLRNGPAEATRVAVVSLVDRGALVTDEERNVDITDAGRRLQAEAPIERAVLQNCRTGAQPVQALTQDAGVQRTAQAIEDDLRQQGLLVTPGQQRQRSRLSWVAAGVLVAVTAARVVQTLAAGHSNLGFLLVLTGLSLLAVWVMAQGRLSAAGLTALTHQQALLRDLRQRAATLQPGRSSRDVALLAGAFGLAALPAAAFAFAGQLYPTARSEGGSGSSSDSGGSDGDGDGGGGGDGCGGGGCGGGGSSD